MKFRLVSIVKKPFFRFVMTLLAAIFDFEHNSAIARKYDYLGVSGKNFSQTGRAKRVQVRSFFWSIFSRIRTEYGDLLRPNTGKYGPEKTPSLDTFPVVLVCTTLAAWLTKI